MDGFEDSELSGKEEKRDRQTAYRSLLTDNALKYWKVEA
jgi:hypothetical protein